MRKGEEACYIDKGKARRISTKELINDTEFIYMLQWEPAGVTYHADQEIWIRKGEPSQYKITLRRYCEAMDFDLDLYTQTKNLVQLTAEGAKDSRPTKLINCRDVEGYYQPEMA